MQTAAQESTRVARDTPPASVRRWTLIALALVTFAAFVGVLENGWIFYDDHEYVTDNPHVRAGLTWEGFTWFLSQFHVGNWHPLTSLSHMLDVELYGLSPRGPHAENLVLHVVNACLLLHVLFLYTRRFFAAAGVAVLFALHPLRVESVAWISERKDVLSAFFFLLTLWAYKAQLERPSAARRACTVAALVLGLLAKPMLVTVPFVLLLLDVWPLARVEPLRERVREKWPLFAAMVASIVITVVAQSSSGATTNLQDNPLPARLYTALTAYARYLWLTIAPHDLAPAYPYARELSYTLPLLSLLGIAAVTVCVWRVRHTRPHLTLGWLWYLGMLVPVIGLVQVGSQSHADRYTYLPLIGIAIALSYELGDLVSRRPKLRLSVIAAGCAACVTLFALTRAQVALWKDTKTLFEHTLRVTSDNTTAEKIYADALLEAGDFDGAALHYRRSLELYPWFPNGRNNLGCALARAGRFDEAAAQFEIAVETEPRFDVYLNWGSALHDAGRYTDAVLPLERAVALDPSNARAHSVLGRVLLQVGRFEEAQKELAVALALDPNDIETRRGSALTHMQRGDIEAAIADYRRLLEALPNDIDTLVTIALIRGTHPDAAHRNGAEALRCAERARDTATEPFPVMFSALAGAYAEVGRLDEAVAAVTQAIELARSQGDSGVLPRLELQLAEHRAGRAFRAR
ncbi:MAG: tetratricopeptide repeat protein [Planctomycetes bacterium]|nr:tetratricopeptide repeat protein [Planctomycetota bacterium]